MKVSGKRSVSSFLGKVLSVTWYLLFPAITGVIVGIFVAALLPQRSGYLTLHTQFLSLAFTGAHIDNSRPIAIGVLSLVLIGLAVAEVVVYHLRKVFANISGGKPFALENRAHIRAIGVTVISGAVLNAVVCLVVGVFLTHGIHIAGVSLSARAGSPMSGIFLGLVILVLADIFGRGAELQEDHDLTV